MSAIENIESKIKILQEDLKKKTSFMSSINDALKKLSNDKEVTISEINTLQGAIYGYTESVKFMKEQESVPVAEICEQGKVDG